MFNEFLDLVLLYHLEGTTIRQELSVFFNYFWCIDGRGCVITRSKYVPKSGIPCNCFYHVWCIVWHGYVIPRDIYGPKGVTYSDFLYCVWCIDGRGCVRPRVSYSPKGVDPFQFLLICWIHLWTCGVSAQGNATSLSGESLADFFTMIDTLMDMGMPDQGEATDVRGK